MRLGLLLLHLCLVGCDSADPIPDADGDGTADPHDCADDDPAIHPGAPELCNEVDDNCDGVVDEGVEVDVWPDQDGDGFGSGSAPSTGCGGVGGWAASDDDCNDRDPLVHPGAEDPCNGIDDNCDGVKDAEDTTWFADADGDGFGDDTTALATCAPPAGSVKVGGDCNDTDGAIHPGASELCNAQDDDCDGISDLGYETTWYSDADGDGYGSPLGSQTTCAPSSGWVLNGDDCRPSEASAYPGAAEACNDVDDDCDGVVDDGFDVDGDGHFDAVCSFGDDCDDTDVTIYAGAPEECGDTVDQDCDGLDLHCGYMGDYDLSNADVRAVDADVPYAGGHVDRGDVNGDGATDLIFNSIYDGVMIVPGPLDGAVDLGTAATYFTGNMGTIYGGRSIGIGDVDGDGLDDVGFGAPYGTADGFYIAYGPVAADAEGSDADVYAVGHLGSMCGHGAEIADVTGDGVEDALVGCYSESRAGGSGITWLFAGPLSGDYGYADATAALYSSEVAEYSGRWVRGDGDVNGDGVNDLMIAAPFGSLAGMSAGEVYLLQGPITGDTDLASADARLLGTSPNGYLGEYRTMYFGDSDGDGYDDALVAAHYAGEVALFLHPTSGDYEVTSADMLISGAMYFGTGLALEDIDGNGVGDVLASCMYDGSTAGATYLFWDLRPGTYTTADADGSFLGETTSFAGSTSNFADMNDDGWLDVVVGAQALDGSGGFYVEFQEP